MVAIFLAAAASLAFAPNSAGFVLEGAQWPAASVVTFAQSLGPAGRTLMDGNSSWDAAAMPAPDAWDNVMGGLQFRVTARIDPPISSGDTVNAIVFSNSVFGQSFGSKTLAVTYYRSSGSKMLEADVLFNKAQSFDSYRGPLHYDSNGFAISDIRRVLIHELGHALGLDHPDDHGQYVDAIMNSTTSDRETVSSDDIAGAQKMYGGPASSHALVSEDFNGDGSADYLFLMASTRQTATWHLQGNVFVSGAYGPTLPAGWGIVGAADMNLDGKPDYLLFNPATRETAVWFMNDTTYLGGAFGPTLPAGWALIAAVDCNNDQRPDYVLHNPTTRQTALWFMNNTTFIGGAFGPTLPAGWTLVDADDFNGDKKGDFVLFNAITRQTALWYLNGTAVVGATYGSTLPAGWTLQGAADFNRDGKPDYALFNPSTRQTALWYLNGIALLGGVFAPILPPDSSLGSH